MSAQRASGSFVVMNDSDGGMDGLVHAEVLLDPARQVKTVLKKA